MRLDDKRTRRQTSDSFKHDDANTGNCTIDGHIIHLIQLKRARCNNFVLLYHSSK